MANRYAFDTQSLDRQVKTLYMIVDVGAAGAPTLRTTNNSGVKSITRAGAGNYDIVLDDNWTLLLGFKGMLLDAASEDIVFQLEQEAVASGTLSIFTNAVSIASILVPDIRPM